MSTKPASAALTDVELEHALKVQLASAEQTVTKQRAMIADCPSLVYAAEHYLRDAVIAETKVAILAATLKAPAERRRDSLASRIGQALDSEATTSSAFANAAGSAVRVAAKHLLRSFSSEIDSAQLVFQLS
jgi:hypothetical protein